MPEQLHGEVWCLNAKYGASKLEAPDPNYNPNPNLNLIPNSNPNRAPKLEAQLGKLSAATAQVQDHNMALRAAARLADEELAEQHMARSKAEEEVARLKACHAEEKAASTERSAAALQGQSPLPRPARLDRPPTKQHNGDSGRLASP